jgi:hypothetical protein
MNGLKMRRPSAALVVASVALFVALGGTAGAVVTAAVPLAKRALVADNSKKVGGLTAAQLGTAAAQVGAKLALSESPPGARPASAASSLVTIKTAPWSLGANQGNDFAAACDAGQKAIAGGYDNPSGDALALDTRPGTDGASWRVFIVNLSESAGASGNVFAICLK